MIQLLLWKLNDRGEKSVKKFILSSILALSLLTGCVANSVENEKSINVSMINKDEEIVLVSAPLNLEIMEKYHTKEIQSGIPNSFGNFENLKEDETRVELKFNVDNLQEELFAKVNGTIFYKGGSFDYIGEGMIKKFISPDTKTTYYYGDIVGEGFNFITMFSLEDNRVYIETPTPIQLGEYKGHAMFGEKFVNKEYWDAVFKEEKSTINTEKDALTLGFNKINPIKIQDLDKSNIKEVIQEKNINDNINIFLFKNQDNNPISVGIKSNEKYYFVGEISDTISDDLIGIKEVQVFGKEYIKVHGVLGANYAKAFYLNTEEDIQYSIIQVEGNSTEIDLDEDGNREIISVKGTIPETEIYKIEEDEIFVSNINNSIGANSTRIIDTNKRLFEVYFEPNKPELYSYFKGILKKAS